MNGSVKVTPARMVILGMGWFGTNFFWGFYTGSMPLFLKNFTRSKFTISLVLSLAGVASCIVPPLAGYLSDQTTGRFGRRKPYIVLGMLGVFFCLLGLPHISSFGIVALVSAAMYFHIAFAAVLGVGYAFMLDLIPENRTAEFVGINIISISVAMILGPLIAGKLIDMLGYRSVFPAAAIFMIVGLVILQFVRPRHNDETVAAD